MSTVRPAAMASSQGAGSGSASVAGGGPISARTAGLMVIAAGGLPPRAAVPVAGMTNTAATSAISGTRASVRACSAASGSAAVVIAWVIPARSWARRACSRSRTAVVTSTPEMRTAGYGGPDAEGRDDEVQHELLTRHVADPHQALLLERPPAEQDLAHPRDRLGALRERLDQGQPECASTDQLARAPVLDDQAQLRARQHRREGGGVLQRLGEQREAGQPDGGLHPGPDGRLPS